MERDDQAPELIDLGSVSEDTQGDRGFYWEAFGRMPHPGITDE